MKIDQNALLIGGIVIVGIIVVGLHLGWFHGLLHMNDRPRDTPFDFTDRTKLTPGDEVEQAAMYGHYY